MRLPDGRQIDDFYTVRLPAYTVVVAITADQRVVAERHYRPGARQVTLTLPSGFLEPDEDPLRGAKRELLEETGFRPRSPRSRFAVAGDSFCANSRTLVRSGSTARIPALA